MLRFGRDLGVLFVGLWLCFLIVLLLPLLSLPSLGGSGFYLLVNIVLALVMVPCVLLSLATRLNSGCIYVDNFTKLLFLFVCVISLPLYWADDLSESVYRILTLFFGLFCFVALVNSTAISKSDQIIWMILVSATLQGFYAIAQFFIIFPIQEIDYSRPYGSFYQVNVLASFLVTGVFCSFYLFQRNPLGRIRIFVPACLLVCLISLVLILSRSSFLSLFISFVFILIFCFRERSFHRNRYWFSWFLVSIIVALCVFTYVTEAGSAGRDVGKWSQVGNRLSVYIHVVRMILEKPIWGWGYGSFDHTFLFSWFNDFQDGQISYQILKNLKHPHNEILLWMVEGGLFFIIPFSLLLFAFCHLVLKKWNAQSLLALACLVPIVVHSQFELPFYHSILHWITFVCLIYVLLEEKLGVISVKVFFKQAWVVLFYLFAAMSIVFFATGVQTLSILVDYSVEEDLSKKYVYLSRIKNPFLHSGGIEAEQLQTKLRSAQIIGDVSLIKEYLIELEDYYNQSPYKEIFLDIVTSKYLLGEADEAQKMYNEGSVLYFGEYPFNELIPLKEFVRMNTGSVVVKGF